MTELRIPPTPDAIGYLPCKVVLMLQGESSKKRCQCRKAGLNCTNLCSCSHSGKLCENMRDNDGDDDDDDDDDDDGDGGGNDDDHDDEEEDFCD